MPVGDERQSRRYVERLAHTHQRTQTVELREVCSVAHEISNCRPYEQTAHNELLAAHAVGNNACKRTHDAVYPEEHSHKSAESLSLLQFNDVEFHSSLHGREHLSVHIVEQCHHPKQRHYQPRIKLFGFHFLIEIVFSCLFAWFGLRAASLCDAQHPYI